MATPPNTYTDTPIASHTLANDQPVMRSNYTYLVNTLGTSNAKNGDHQVSFGGIDTNSFEGRHRQVCLNNRHGAAPTVAGIGDGTNALIYADNGNLFFGSQTGAGAFQLTTYNSGSNFGSFTNNYTPQNGGVPPGPVGTGFSAGWIFLPGGLIMQYGTANCSSGTTIQFPITFPTACFSIQCSVLQNTTNRHFAYARSTGSTTSFVSTQLDSGGSGETNTFTWWAIGN